MNRADSPLARDILEYITDRVARLRRYADFTALRPLFSKQSHDTDEGVLARSSADILEYAAAEISELRALLAKKPDAS